MTTSIYKYQLSEVDEQFVSLPEGAEILTVQAQRDQACLWARVDPTAPKERRLIRMIGTGHPIGDDAELRYISTFQLCGGALVFHAFEVLP